MFSLSFTAKQYMEEVKTEKKLKQQKKQAEYLFATSKEGDDSFDSINVYSKEGSLPVSMNQPKPLKKDMRRRSQTVTSTSECTGSTKSLGRDKSDVKNRRSTFYTDSTSMDVTTPFVDPVMEMDKLVVINRSPSQLLDLMTLVIFVTHKNRECSNSTGKLCIFIKELVGSSPKCGSCPCASLPFYFGTQCVLLSSN